MKNIKLLIIVFMIIISNVSFGQAECHLNLPDDLPVMNLLSTTSYTDLDIADKHVIIGSTSDPNDVKFYGNTKFTNCKITLYRKFLYTDKKYEFYNCEIYLGYYTAFRSFNNFAPSNSTLIFDGNCIIGNDPAEILHVEDSNFRFVNNNVDIDSYGHIFHLKNLKIDGDNSFYGNTIKNYSIYDGDIIWVDNLNGELKIGDNNQAKNEFFSSSGAIIREQSSAKKSIRVENSEFNSSDLAIHLKECPLLSVDNCKFNSIGAGSTGILLSDWLNRYDNNLNITNSRFEGNFLHGIHSTSGDISITNNQFNNCTNAIKTSKSSTSGVGNIENNTFTNNIIDVFTTGAFKQLDVSGNNFSGRDFGVLTDGHNKYDITRNTFYNSYAGNIAYANGVNANIVSQNSYTTLIGTHALEDNSGFQFTDNCYNTGGDVYLDGIVSDEIGSASAEANNCFTKGGISDITANTNVFNYYRSDLEIGKCNDPITLGSYDKPNATYRPESTCGSGSVFNGTVRRYCTINFKNTTCKQAKQMLADIELNIANLHISSSYNLKTKAHILKSLQNCRLKLLAFVKTCIDPKHEDPRFPDGEVSALGWTGNEPQLASVALKTSTDKYERAAYISTSLELGQYVELSAYLQSYISTDEEELDFVEVQKLNLRRYITPDTFDPTDDEIDMLVDISNKPHPLAGYARGLYTQLTGEIIIPPIPRITSNRSIVTNNSNAKLVEILPNPFTDQVQISVQSKNKYNIRISDITGKTYYQNSLLESVVEVNTTAWPAGLYFVHVVNDHGLNEYKKLVKQ